jgi:hypothetical protein
MGTESNFVPAKYEFCELFRAKLLSVPIFNLCPGGVSSASQESF